MKKLKTTMVEKKKEKKDRPKMFYIPPILINRYRKFLLFSIATFVVGIIASFIMASTWYMTLIMFTLVALALLLVALVYKQNITYKGYFMMDGEVIYEDKGLGVKNDRRPSSYRIKNSNGDIFQIPVQKKSLVVPIGSTIRVYAPVDVFIYESEGIYKLTNLWCYELISSSDVTDEKE